MGCHTLSDYDGQSAFYCSTTMRAFGPVMPSLEAAEAFIKYLAPRDPRGFLESDLREKWDEFVRLFMCEGCDDVRDTDPCPFCEEGYVKDADGWHHWMRDGK